MAVYNIINLHEIQNRVRIEAEFYKPEYVDNYKTIENLPHLKLKSNSLKISDGTHFTPHYIKSGIKFYSAINVKEAFFVYDESYKFISEAEHRSIHARCPVRSGDVLIRKVGVGPRWSCVVPEGIEEFSIFVSVALVRPNSRLIPEYLSTFINCKYGQLQLLRLNKGISQPDLHLEDIGELIIPEFTPEIQLEISTIIKSAQVRLEESKFQYTQAKQILESELGLDKLSFQKPMGYTAQFSETITGMRFDADYFQTPFRQIQSHLDKLETVTLFQLVEIVKGIEVGSEAYKVSGRAFLRVSNIKEKGLGFGNSDKYISNNLYKILSAYQPQVGELLLTKDGTAGVCFAVDEEVNGIISGGIVRLLPRNGDIPNEYLALVINSKACRMQVEQDCSGALILHWKPSSIRKLRIPLLTKPKMQEIADLVSKSKQAKRESERLFEQAKTRVEQLIEAAVQA